MNIWSILLRRTSLFALLAAPCISDSTTDLFNIPGPPAQDKYYVVDPIWTIGEFKTIAWTTTLVNYNLTLWQQNVDGLEYANAVQTIYYPDPASSSGSQTYSWQVQLYNSNLTFSPVYFFWINHDTPGGFTSHYFNITERADAFSASTSTTGASTTNPANGISSTTSVPATGSGDMAVASMTSSAQQPTTPMNTALPSPVDSSDIRIGLGLGIGIGVPLILITGVWVGLKAAAQSRQRCSRMIDGSVWDERSHRDMNQAPPAYGRTYKRAPIVEAPGVKEIVEVHGWNIAHELPTRRDL